MLLNKGNQTKGIEKVFQRGEAGHKCVNSACHLFRANQYNIVMIVPGMGQIKRYNNTIEQYDRTGQIQDTKSTNTTKTHMTM